VAEFIDAELEESQFQRTDLSGAVFRTVDLSEAQFRDVLLIGVVVSGVELVDVDIQGEIENVTINGVSIGPLVDAELNKRYPERAKMRPEDPSGFREAWEILNEDWEHRLYAERDLDALVAGAAGSG
jgi:uncharacterized protein YjbI with pentapeptide repeats